MKGWEIIVKWEEWSSNWISLKDTKNFYPVKFLGMKYRGTLLVSYNFYGGFNMCWENKIKSLGRLNLSTGCALTSLKWIYPDLLQRQSHLMTIMATHYRRVPQNCVTKNYIFGGSYRIYIYICLFEPFINIRTSRRNTILYSFFSFSFGPASSVPKITHYGVV